VFVCVTTAAEP